MKDSVNTSKTNGSQWLFELKYGAEKSFQFREGIKGRQPEDFIFDDHLINLAGKLAVAKLRLNTGLLGAEVSVTPISDEPNSVCGRLIGYDLDKATITLRSKSNSVKIPFCEFQLDDATLISSTLLELETDREYKL